MSFWIHHGQSGDKPYKSTTDPSTCKTSASTIFCIWHPDLQTLDLWAQTILTSGSYNCETSWSCKPHMDRKIHNWKSNKSPCLGPLCDLDSITCVLLMFILILKRRTRVSFKHHIISTCEFQYLYFTSSLMFVGAACVRGDWLYKHGWTGASMLPSTSVIWKYINISPTWIPSPQKTRGQIQTQETLTISPPVCQFSPGWHCILSLKDSNQNLRLAFVVGKGDMTSQTIPNLESQPKCADEQLEPSSWAWRISPV